MAYTSENNLSNDKHSSVFAWRVSDEGEGFIEIKPEVDVSNALAETGVDLLGIPSSAVAGLGDLSSMSQKLFLSPSHKLQLPDSENFIVTAAYEQDK